MSKRNQYQNHWGWLSPNLGYKVQAGTIFNYPINSLFNIGNTRKRDASTDRYKSVEDVELKKLRDIAFGLYNHYRKSPYYGRNPVNPMMEEYYKWKNLFSANRIMTRDINYSTGQGHRKAFSYSGKSYLN